MAEQEHHEGTFKVTDRRKFTIEGELRDPQQAEAEAPAPAPPPPAAAASFTPASVAQQNAGLAPASTAGPASTSAPVPQAEPEDDGDPGFERIVLSFTQTAMMQLGLVALDPGQPLEPDLLGARETIDMLSILEVKTRGNLNAREKRLVAETLHELQLAFVGVQRQMLKPRQ